MRSSHLYRLSSFFAAYAFAVIGLGCVIGSIAAYAFAVTRDYAIAVVSAFREAPPQVIEHDRPDVALVRSNSFMRRLAKRLSARFTYNWGQCSAN